MNKIIFFAFANCLLSVSLFAQSTFFYNDADEKFKEAKSYFQNGQYSLAYPMLKEIRRDITPSDKINKPIVVQEVDYYTIACGLMQNEGRAEEEALGYIGSERNSARVQMLSYHLAEYYFRKKDFAKAISLYEQANIANLSNAEIGQMKFNQGYAYFTEHKFAQAKPLFNAVRSIKGDPNYAAANYYYGFLAFKDKQYKEALASFLIVENDQEYASVVPYYIAQIYYLQNRKDEAITYAQNKLKAGAGTQYYELELKQLLGHAHFERKEYAMALPYLQDYISRSSKVRKEDLYELSYCYYQANNWERAIEGFKQLSGREDSLSQHSMYLLGDAYLKTDQKASARSAFLFCASNSSNASQKEISKFQYAKLSYELGYQDEALNSMNSFLTTYPSSVYSAEAKELMVAMLANTNNYRDALALLESLRNPTENARRLYPAILYGRATEYINDGRLVDANSMLDKALIHPYNTSVLPFINFWKAELAYRNNNLDDAIQYLNVYNKMGAPASGAANATNANYNLAYCYLRKENFDAALGLFEPIGKNANMQSPSLVQDAYIRTADCYLMLKNYSKAKAIFDKIINYSWPTEDYATFQNAMIAGITNPQEKLTALNTINRKFPSSSLITDANMEIANTYLAGDRFSEALPYLTNVIKSTGNNSLKPQAYLKLGIAYYNLENNSEALNQYKKLIEQYPNTPEAAFAFENVERIYVADGKPNEYAEFMRKAGKPLSVNVEDSLTYKAAFAQYDGGNRTIALKSFETYLQKFPGGTYSLDANFFTADIYNSNKQWEKALTGYEKVAALSPNRYAEKAILEAARINFFEIKNYEKAENYFAQLKQLTGSQENKLEAMRGLLRSQYQQQKWSIAVANAKELTSAKGSSSDDKALAAMAIGKSYQIAQGYDEAIAQFKTAVALNKAALAAEARYEIANSFLALNKFSEAEKAGFETINKSGSYGYWVTKAYILLGDVYFKQKDYFNAKATFQSVVDNSLIDELKIEARQKLDNVVKEESHSSKLQN